MRGSKVRKEVATALEQPRFIVEREWYHAGAQQMVAGPAGDNDSTESEWELPSDVE